MPEEIRGLALWLASDASSFVTGQVLVEDGGILHDDERFRGRLYLRERQDHHR